MPNFFKKSANLAPLKVLIGLFLTVSVITSLITYYATPKYTRVGYQPIQPVLFNHAKHAGELGIDCRYCHSSVDRSEHAEIPDAATCMNCHSQVATDSPLLEPIREAFKTGSPMQWVRVHRTPQYVYFNHAVHVNRGVSCVECHGRVDQMENGVRHEKSLSMGFCLDCHRNPEDYVREPDKVYDLSFAYPDRKTQREKGLKFVHDWKINPPQSCSGCHR